MKYSGWLGTLLAAFLVGSQATAAEPACGNCQGEYLLQGSPLQSWHPTGGWLPYGGGLVKWWDPHCFPRGGCPDDYQRKPLPKVCCPQYPPFYSCGNSTLTGLEGCHSAGCGAPK
jgi:hypothetical protein